MNSASFCKSRRDEAKLVRLGRDAYASSPVLPESHCPNTAVLPIARIPRVLATPNPSLDPFVTTLRIEVAGRRRNRPQGNGGHPFYRHTSKAFQSDNVSVGNMSWCLPGFAIGPTQDGTDLTNSVIRSINSTTQFQKLFPSSMLTMH